CLVHHQNDKHQHNHQSQNLLHQASDVFLSARNFNNLLLASSTIGIIAVFSTMLMIGGGLDLSVASTAALSGVLIGVFQESWGLGNAVAVALATGALIGLINGILVTYVGINALITTLGMLSIARGMAFVLADGLTIPVFDLAGTQPQAYTLFAQLSEAKVNLLIAQDVPLPVVVMITLFVIGFFVLRFTTYGRAMYAIGGNREASRLAGLSVKRYRMIAFTLSGLSAAVAGVFLTSRLYAADPKAAPNVELTVITAVVLGGTSLAGGRGSLVGTFLGVLILSTLLNGMNLQSISTDYQNVAQGTVLLLAVFIDQVRLGNVRLGTDRIRKWLLSRADE
ncbi:MAG: ABC transporter permease, partial [Chloroflexota bacterium]